MILSKIMKEIMYLNGAMNEIFVQMIPLVSKRYNSYIEKKFHVL